MLKALNFHFKGMEISILYSPSIQRLLDRHIPIRKVYSHKSFSSSLLSEIKFDDFLDKLQGLTKGVELNRDIPTSKENIEPGTVYVFDVDVTWEENDVKVNEREVRFVFNFFRKNILRTFAYFLEKLSDKVGFY